MSYTKLRPTLNWLGILILVAGLGSAALIWRAQDAIDRQNEASDIANGSDPLPPLDSRRHVRDIEINYGKFGVLIEEGDELLHGKPLAKTIAVVSAITAAGFFLVAARLPR